MLLPLGLVNLKANIKIQYISCAVIIFGVVEFCWHFIVKRGLQWNAVPLFGTSYTQLVSVMIFTLSFTTLVSYLSGNDLIKYSTQKTL
jgi:hypothetical protein